MPEVQHRIGTTVGHPIGITAEKPVRVALQAFDLDDPRPQIRQQRGGKRGGVVVRALDNGDAVQRTPERPRPLRGGAGRRTIPAVHYGRRVPPGRRGGTPDRSGCTGDLRQRSDLEERTDAGIVELLHVVGLDHLTMAQRLLRALDDVTADVSVLEVRLHPFGGGLLLHPIRNEPDQLELGTLVGELVRCALEPLVFPDPIESEHVDPSREEVWLGVRMDHPPAVLGLHPHPDEIDLARVPVMGQAVLVLLGGLVRTGLDRQALSVAEQPPHLRVLPAAERLQKVRLDQLAPPGEITGHDGGKDSLHRQHGREVRPVPRRAVHRSLTVPEPSRLVAEDARLGHDQTIVRLDLHERTGGTEATDGAIDQPRVRRRELLVPHARTTGGFSSDRFDHHIHAGAPDSPARLDRRRCGCRVRRSASPSAAADRTRRSRTDRLRVARSAPRPPRSRPGSWWRAGRPCPESDREHADLRRLLASTHPSLWSARRLLGPIDPIHPRIRPPLLRRLPAAAFLTVYESTDGPVTRQGGYAASETCMRPARLPPMTLRIEPSSRALSSSTKQIGSDMPSGWG